MIQQKRRVNDLQAKIKNISALIDFKAREIGELIASVPDASMESAKFAEIYSSIHRIKSEIPEKSQMIRKIKKIVACIETTRDEIGKVRTETREKEKDASALAEKTGRFSFNIFKAHPNEYKKYEPVFASVSKLNGKEENSGPKGNQVWRSGQTILSQIIDTAKALYSSQSRQSTITRFGKACQSAGRLVIKSDFRKVVQDPGLDELIEGMIRLEKELAELGKKAASLVSKKQKYAEDLASLGVKGSSFLRIRELENERKKLEFSLDQKHALLGSMFIDNPHVFATESTEITNLHSDITELMTESSECSSAIDIIEAQIEIDAIKEKIKKADDKIEQLSRSIRKSEEEITTQKNRIAQLERDKQKYEKIANGK